jgi:RNA polymerase sigma-70 factor (ECF subfamily)
MLATWLNSNGEVGAVPSPGGQVRPESSPAGSDQELLERIWQLDLDAVMEAYDRYQASIYKFVLEMSGDPSVAADITQDVFLLMLQRRGLLSRVFARFDVRKGSLEGYLLGVARRLTRKLAAKQSRWEPLSEADPASPMILGQEIESRSTLQRLHSAIAQLPVKYREVVVLCCLQEKSYEQAAAVLSCSTGTIASRLSRARKLLSERLL